MRATAVSAEIRDGLEGDSSTNNCAASGAGVVLGAAWGAELAVTATKAAMELDAMRSNRLR
jgi:hypothetical protein